MLLSWECTCALCAASSAWPVSEQYCDAFLLVAPAVWSSMVQGRSCVQHTSWETPYSCRPRALVSPLCLPSHRPTSAVATLGSDPLLHRVIHAMGITLHLEGSLHRSDGVRQPTNWMRRRPRPRCGLCVFALQPTSPSLMCKLGWHLHGAHALVQEARHAEEEKGKQQLKHRLAPGRWKSTHEIVEPPKPVYVPVVPWFAAVTHILICGSCGRLRTRVCVVLHCIELTSSSLTGSFRRDCAALRSLV